MDDTAERELATLKPWEQRHSYLQFMPQGDNAESLRLLLDAVSNGMSGTSKAPVTYEHESDRNTLGSICRRILQKLGLVTKGTMHDTWALTKESIRWLETNDNVYLASVICSNLQFSIEMLAQMTEPRTLTDLLAIATGEYKTNWNSEGQIRERNKWFHDLGLVNYLKHDKTRTYVLSEIGQSLVSMVQYPTPEDVWKERVGISDEAQLPSGWALQMCSTFDAYPTERKTSFPRFPGKRDEFLAVTLDFLAVPRPFDDYKAFVESLREWDAHTAQTYRSGLNVAGLVRQAPSEEYEATEPALEWLESRRTIDLACILHCKCSFFFEILQELSNGELSVDKLSLIAKEKYGVLLGRENKHLKSRLSLLKEAKLVLYANKRVEITELGKALLRELPTLEPEPLGQDPSEAMDIEDFIEDLKAASRRSSTPEDFEVACVNAFKRLGFEAIHKGKKGQTDALATGRFGTFGQYTAIIDAKASEKRYGNIDFDNIDEHRDTVHQADYALVVSPEVGKANASVRKAKKHEDTLMDVDELCSILECHELVPLTTYDYESLIFQNNGRYDFSVLSTARDKTIYKGKILFSVLDTLANLVSIIESKDGYYTLDNIFTSLCLNEKEIIEIGEKPDIDDVRDALVFLSSPFINAVDFNKTTRKYYANYSVHDLMIKMKSIYLIMNTKFNHI